MIHTLRLEVLLLLFLMLTAQGTAAAGGPFGPPQPVGRETGGLHTGIGYWYQADQLRDGSVLTTAGNHGYSEAGYSVRGAWEIYARLGIADLMIFDGFSPLTPSTTTAKRDYKENTNYFCTLGVKRFHALNRLTGWGAFIQGSYYLRDFTDNVTGSQNGTPFSVELRVRDLWDLRLGVGWQTLTSFGAKLYGGPYAYYTQARLVASTKPAGLVLAASDALRNRTAWGGFVGVEAPLAKGFRLHIEGQYSERLSAGTAVSFSY